MALSVLLAGGLAIAGAAPAVASDNCKRLPSASLIILVPEGGCDVTDPDKQPKVPDDVTVIRGSAPLARLDRTATSAVKRSFRRSGGPLIIIINSDL